MKKFGGCFVLSFLLLSVFTAVSAPKTASASWSSPQNWVQVGTVIQVDRSSIGDPAPPILTGGIGGEFRVRHNGTSPIAAPATQFYTFCVEVSETFSFNENLRVAGIGGISRDSNIPLSAVTSALYREFLRVKGTTQTFFGQVSGATYIGSGNSSNNDAVSLQRAVWYFQGNQQNLTPAQSAANKFIQAGYHFANTLNGGLTNALLASNVGLFGGVSIMNLVNNSSSAARQDMLIYNGDSGTVIIPEPAAFALFSFGLLGCSFIRRRHLS